MSQQDKVKARKKKTSDASVVPFTWAEAKKQSFLLIVSAAFLIYGIIFYYVPLGGWIMAFQNYKPKTGLLHSKWVGLAKFKFLFDDDKFIRVIRNTLAMGVLNLITTFVMAIIFAILLNEVRNVLAKKSIQTISYMPHFLSWIIVTGILHDAMSAGGVVNEVIQAFGGSPILFFSETKYFWPIVAFANVWKETGWNAIIYLAAITSIDPCLYEAASIDGAGRLSKILHIFRFIITISVLIVNIVSWCK